VDFDVARGASAVVFVTDVDAPVLAPDDAHHLLDVLRLGAGATVLAADGDGAYRVCTLQLAAAKSRSGHGTRVEKAQLSPAGPVRQAPSPGRKIAVGLALGKGERPEWAVQKLTELGVDQILFLETARGVVRPERQALERRRERLRRVAREAAMQSRRLRLPEISGPLPLAEALASAPAPVAVAEIGGRPLDAGVASVFVGPEGGFTAEELKAAPHIVGLPGYVLRTETAAVAAGVLLAACRHIPGAGVEHSPIEAFPPLSVVE
jgi:16S rRNA (uracil1498-N3)-methyltransferase